MDGVFRLAKDIAVLSRPLSRFSLVAAAELTDRWFTRPQAHVARVTVRAAVRILASGRLIMRAVFLLFSVLFALPLLSTFHVSWIAAVVVLTVLAVSARRPEDGLLLIAGLLPLATPIGLLMIPVLSGRQAGELLLLPFLTAASARHAIRKSTDVTPLVLMVIACAAVITISAIVHLAWDQYATAALGRNPWSSVWTHLTTTYLAESAAFPLLGQSMVWLEGLLLCCVVDLQLRQEPGSRDRVCRVLLLGIVAASTFSAYRLAEVYLRGQRTIRDTLAMLATARIGIHMSDINAVGSLYAMFVVPTLWLAFTRRQLWLWAGFLSILLALWWSGSRAAVAAACCGVLAAMLAVRAIDRRIIVFGLCLAAIVIAVSVRTAIRPLSFSDALRIRTEMAVVGLQIIAANPGFGVGSGKFPAASRRFVSPELVRLFPSAARGENAHNNFVQILAEFGLVGGSAIFGVIFLPLWMAWRSAGRFGATPALAGFAGGIVAFLITCLFGHPLITSQCLWLFFIVLGVVAGLSSSSTCGSRP